MNAQILEQLNSVITSLEFAADDTTRLHSRLCASGLPGAQFMAMALLSSTTDLRPILMRLYQLDTLAKEYSMSGKEKQNAETKG